MIIRLVDAVRLRLRSLRNSHDAFTCFRPLLFSVPLILLGAAEAGAASLTLQWDPPIDGNTTGYVLWYGNAVGHYTAWTNVGFVTSYRVEGLADATAYCFALQAYSASGETSDYSIPVCATTPTPSSGGSTPPSGGTTTPPAEISDGTEIVLYASTASKLAGNWAKAATSGAAGGTAMVSTDKGFVLANAPLAAPVHYFQLGFDARAGTPYRLWLRLRARNNSKWNDSVWVQFSNSLVSGRTAYRIGTTSALLVNLEPCDACGVSGWGWTNSSYWLKQGTSITFGQTGPQTIRIQTREDGVEIDQIVLSAGDFASAAPGAKVNDVTVLPQTIIKLPTSTPYSGTPIRLPGTVTAANFDNGGAGVAYVDSTTGNSGGVYRTTDVDLQTASVGGYNITSTTAGEWVKYTVNVPTTASYTMKLRVASVGGGSLQLVAGPPSGTSRTVTVPNTGGWQTWTTVSVPMTLTAGKQILTVNFVTANVNLRSIVVP